MFGRDLTNLADAGSKMKMTLVLRPTHICCLLFCMAACAARNPFAPVRMAEPDMERFPGWKGEVVHPQFVSSMDNQSEVGPPDGAAPQLASLTASAPLLPQTLWNGKIEQLSWEPRIYVLHGFLSDAECDHLMKIAEPRLQESTVVNSVSGQRMPSKVRTSWGVFLGTHEDAVVERIEKRISMVAMIPQANAEALHILRYQDGQKYEVHSDWFRDKVNQVPEKGGQRLATALMYLTTPEEGGETVFPDAQMEPARGPGWSHCASGRPAVKATRGNAVLFFDQRHDGNVDWASLHGSCPTTKGVKWSATKWFHSLPFNSAIMNDCLDKDPFCEDWAHKGELFPVLWRPSAPIDCALIRSNMHRRRVYEESWIYEGRLPSSLW